MTDLEQLAKHPALIEARNNIRKYLMADSVMIRDYIPARYEQESELDRIIAAAVAKVYAESEFLRKAYESFAADAYYSMDRMRSHFDDDWNPIGASQWRASEFGKYLHLMFEAWHKLSIDEATLQPPTTEAPQ